MFEPVRPMITSKATAPDASFAIASSEELYVAIWTERRVLLLEALDQRRVDVVGVVVDAQRAALGRAPVRDRLVRVGDAPR